MRKIKEINIEGNNTGDKFIEKLWSAIETRPLMESLNLSHNLLTNKGGEAIANMLMNNSTITSLFLKWNNIRAKGAANIWDALKTNDSLKILELSFNPIGVGLKADKEFGKLTEMYGDDIDLYENDDVNNITSKNNWNVCDNFSEMFIHNKSLIHLDLSYWGFSLIECKVLHEGLKQNHTILGLHMMGNKMNVDSLGFLREDDMLVSSTHVVPRIENSLETGTIPDSKIGVNSCSNWWIWEGWTQIKIKFDPYSSNSPPDRHLGDDDKIFIHFSFDDYRPDSMTWNDNDTFTVIRMVPPVEFNYYFSINGVPKYATDLEKETILGEVNLNIPYANIPSNIRKSREIIDKNYLGKLEWFPRPKRKNLVIYDEEVPIPDWNIKDSVFWGYMIDTNDLYMKCFEFDWSQCKIPKIIKDPNELFIVKKYLKSIYKPIRETYKYYAGISPCGHIPCIGQNAFNEIINLTNIVDGKDLKLSDIDLEFISTKAGNKNITLNPERWLVRYQLMEVLVRIAIHKYFNKNSDIKGRNSLKTIGSPPSSKGTSRGARMVMSRSEAVK